MKYLVILFIYFNLNYAFCQKLYVSCPENINIPLRNEFLKGDTVKVTLFDGRVIPKKSKVLCSSEEILKSIFQELKETYPNTVFNYDNSLYSKKNIEGKYIKIGISAFHAGLGSDAVTGIGFSGGNISTMIIPTETWNGSTTFIVELYNGDKSIKKTFSNLSSQSNLWGYKSAKKALNQSYIKTFQNLLFFIDENL
ncbi:hypothetical protein [Sphingobacterium hungaricum]